MSTDPDDPTFLDDQWMTLMARDLDIVVARGRAGVEERVKISWVSN